MKKERNTFERMFDKHIAQLGSVDPQAVANVLCLAASAPHYAEQIAGELRTAEPQGQAVEWREREIWTKVPPCFSGIGVEDGWMLIAVVLGADGPNPAIAWTCNTLGLNITEAVCRLVRQGPPNNKPQTEDKDTNP